MKEIRRFLISGDNQRSVIYVPKTRFNHGGVKWFPDKKKSASPDGYPGKAHNK